MKDSKGRTPIWRAAYVGSEQAVSLLLQSGAVDIELKNNEGQSPLWQPACYCRSAVIELLLESEASLHSRDNDGKMLLAAAAEDDFLGKKHGTDG